MCMYIYIVICIYVDSNIYIYIYIYTFSVWTIHWVNSVLDCFGSNTAKLLATITELDGVIFQAGCLGPGGLQIGTWTTPPEVS